MKITLRDLSEEVVAKILDDLISNTDPVVIVYIDCEGGSPLLAFSIFSALRLSQKKVITHALCRVYSAALIIYLAGEIRYAHEFSHFMIHEVSFETEGEPETRKAKNLKQEHEELVHDTEKLYSLIARESTLKVNFIRKRVKAVNDWYFYGDDESIKYGIVHKIGFPREDHETIVSMEDPEANK